MEKLERKLIRQRFKRSIKLGTGECHLIMMEYPDLDFSYDIIDSSWNFYSYDSLEGSRAVYLFELIELSQQKEKIKRRNASGNFPLVSLKPFETAYKELSEKLQPLVYELGFLRI